MQRVIHKKLSPNEVPFLIFLHLFFCVKPGSNESDRPTIRETKEIGVISSDVERDERLLFLK